MHSGIELSRSRHLAPFAFAFCFMPPMLTACSSSSSSSDAGNTPSNILITDDSNYIATSSLAISTVKTKPGADLSISWDKLTTNLLCSNLDPTTAINSVNLLGVTLSKEDIQKDLGAGDLPAKNVPTYFNFTVASSNTSTSAKLSDFKFGTNPIQLDLDYTTHPNDTLTYLLLFAKGTKTGYGNQSMLFLEPTDGEANTSVAAPAGCPAGSDPILTFSADIKGRTKVSAPIAAPWVVDWHQITKDGWGNDVIYVKVDSLFVAHYDMTLDQLQNRVREMEDIATAKYKIDLSKVAGVKTADLATAVEVTSGKNFSGFTPTDGVWALALECSKCYVPAPIVVAILNPS